MKHFLSLLYTFIIFYSVSAQFGMPVSGFDTILKCPFFYYGDFPETGIYHDSTYCEITLNMCLGELDSLDHFISHHPEYHGYMTYMHSDDTLKAIGVAFGVGYVEWEYNTFIYGEDTKTELAHASGIYYDLSSWDTSNYYGLIIPGFNPPPLFGVSVKGAYFAMSFFDEPINIVGDFYVGFSGHHMHDTSNQQQICLLCHAYEIHEPPYNFPQRVYSIKENDTWVSRISSGRILPILFPIVEPPCPKVDSVRVTVDSTGYLVAEWDSLPYQEQWVVYYQGPGMSIIDTVDRCRWSRHVFSTESYSVSVRSRCTNLRSLTWSDISAPAESVDTTAAITEIDNSKWGIEIYPNPSDGDVIISRQDAGGPAEVTVLDLAGHEVVPPTALHSSLSTLHFPLPSGSYLLRLTTPTGTTTHRFTIAR